MNQLTVHDLEGLAQVSGPWCVSIYMPTIKAGNLQQNSIRFKNLLQQSEKMLHEVGMEPQHINRFLRKAETLARDTEFWLHQDHGLAVFISKNDLRTYQLPVEVEELVIVNDNFYLKPLLSHIYEGGEYYILTLSQKNIKLLKGNPGGVVDEIELEDIPRNIDDALNKDYGEEQRHFHTQAAQTSGRGSNTEQAGMYHGHGDSESDKKLKIFQYFQKVNKGVTEKLKESQSPLVIAGVQYLLPIYKEANTYKHLMEKGIEGSHDDSHPKELHEAAWKLVKPMFEKTKEEIIQRFRQLDGWKDQRITRDLHEVILAAPYGRVEVLFVDKNAKQWGSYDEEKMELSLANQPGPGSRDLLDFAAIQTLAKGGIVYAVETDEIPGGGGPVAAILRY